MINALQARLRQTSLGLLSAVALAGCASDGSSSSTHYYSNSPSSFYYDNAWYDHPYYWYDYDYIVVAPDRPDRPVRPEHPIEPLPGDGPRPRPADLEPRPYLTPGQASERRAGAATGTNRARSRMPAAQPRTSPRASRPSIPSRPMPGGMRGGGLRRR